MPSPTGPFAKCGCRQSVRIEPVTERDAADDRADIEKARSHRRHAEDIFRVQHSHDQRRERDEQDEREHDPREQNRQRSLFRATSSTGVMTPIERGAKTIPSSVTALMKTRVRVATLLARLPGRFDRLRSRSGARTW